MIRTRARKMLLAAVAVLVLAGGGLLVAAQAGPSGAAITQNDFVVRTTSATLLSNTANVKSTVASLSLPAGNWVIHADDSAVGLNSIADVVRCNLVVGTRSASHATEVGNSSGYPLVATVGITIGVRLTTATTVFNRCWHDNTTGSSYYIDPDANLWAHKTASLGLTN